MEQIFKADNQFAFKCPTFGSEVLFKDCLTIEAQYMKGQADPARGGCRACLISSKCPVPFMIKEAFQQGGRYYSKDEVVGHVSAAILERLDPVLIIPGISDKIPMSPEERAAIAAANARERKGAPKAVELSKPSRKATTHPRASQRAPDAAPEKKDAFTTAASATYADAINVAIEKTVAPAEPVHAGGIAAPEDPIPAIMAPRKPIDLPKPEPAPAPTGKLSLLEIARRKKAAAAAAAAA
jgi:hypothetical protein